MNVRQIVLVLALLAVLVLAFWPQPEETGVIEPVRRAGAPASHAVPAAGPTQTVGVRFATSTGNLFPTQTWRPPPAKIKPAAPLPPPPPAPPEFPFSYSGHWLEDGVDRVFLSQGENLVRAKVGDVVAGNWRLDKMEEGSLVFTYLPLDMQKNLRTK